MKRGEAGGGGGGGGVRAWGWMALWVGGVAVSRVSHMEGASRGKLRWGTFGTPGQRSVRIWCGRECPFEMMMPWKGGAQILTLTRAKLAGAAQSAARRAKSQLMPAHISPLEVTC